MRLSILSTVTSLIAVAVAQSGGSTANPPTVSSSFSVTAGQPATFTWKPTTQGTVTLTLRSGAASDLNKGTVIASSIQNSGSYTFTLPSSTTRNSDYTIEISSDSDPSAVNYTPQFVVESSNTVESITPSGSSASTPATASSMASSATSAASMKSSAPMMASSMTSASSMMTSGSSSATSGASSATAAASTTAAGKTASSTSGSSSSAIPAPSSGASVARGAEMGLAVVMVGAVALL